MLTIFLKHAHVLLNFSKTVPAFNLNFVIGFLHSFCLIESSALIFIFSIRSFYAFCERLNRNQQSRNVDVSFAKYILYLLSYKMQSPLSLLTDKTYSNIILHSICLYFLGNKKALRQKTINHLSSCEITSDKPGNSLNIKFGPLS